MTEENNITISTDILEQLYKEFVEFIKIIANEDFVSFKKSKYVDLEENYKYAIYREAKRNLGNKDWKSELIGTGEIQKLVFSAIIKNAIHLYKSYDNNLIYWIQKDNFQKLGKNKELEQLFFDFYKTKISNQRAFEGLNQYFEYQLIAYLFFIKDYNQFLPISQDIFDKVISNKLNIADFKTRGRASWDNYKTFIEIIKQTHRFLRTKDRETTLLDAHSFLYILGKQREDWLKKLPNQESKSQDNSAVSENLESEKKEVNTQEDFSIEAEALQEETDKALTNNQENAAKQFTPTDIVWIKNVTNTETGQAYMNLSSDKFILHFPNQHKTNISSPQIGEIILLRQKINGISVFTHLVTPIDNETVDSNEHPDFRFGRRVQLIAKTSPENAIKVSSTNWSRISFGGISQGNACRIENIKDIGFIDDLQFEIWEQFIPFFVKDQIQSVKTTSAFINEIEIIDPNLTVTEGKLRLVSHYARERNPEIVRSKKQQAVANETLFCEICTFSFRARYDVDFIECHHRTPISQTGETKTRLEDLALVCANCHRMLHKKIDGKFLSIEELKSRLNK